MLLASPGIQQGSTAPWISIIFGMVANLVLLYRKLIYLINGNPLKRLQNSQKTICLRAKKNWASFCHFQLEKNDSWLPLRWKRSSYINWNRYLGPSRGPGRAQKAIIQFQGPGMPTNCMLFISLENTQFSRQNPVIRLLNVNLAEETHMGIDI